MKKIFTALLLLMCTGTLVNAQTHLSPPKMYHVDPRSAMRPHHAPSSGRSVVCDTSDVIDYNAYDEASALGAGLMFHGSWYTQVDITAQELSSKTNTTLYPDHAGRYTYAQTRFDSIVFADVNSPYTTSYYNRSNSTIYLDSVGFLMGLSGDTVAAHGKMLHDSLVFKIYSITGTTVSATPVKTIVFSGYNQLRPFFRNENYLGYNQIGVNYQFTVGQSFAVRMEYLEKDTSTHVLLSYTYADSCGTITYMSQQYTSPAYPSALIGEASWAAIGTTGTVTPQNSGFAYNLGTGVAANCSFLYTQNWEILPIINICRSITGAAPTVVTTAATSVVSTTATINGTVNANSDPATVTFNWGLTNAYGNTVAGVPSTVTGSTATAVYANLTGLAPNTTYHYRVSATNTSGPTNGADLTFTTTANGAPCTPDANVTTGISPSSDNVSCVTKGTSFSQTYTFVIPAQVTSIHIDSIVNLPTGLTWAADLTPPTYAGGAKGCLIISGTTNAACGQYRMLIYVTIVTAFGTQQGELSTLATTFGIPGFSPEFLRVIASGDACPAVNTSQTANYAAYANCGGSSGLTLTTAQTNVNCFGQSTGSATVTPSGGTTYTYAWTNSGSTATINNLAAGTYTVTVTSGALTATATVNITQPTAALSATAAATATSCSSNTGTVTPTVTGGTTAYTYLWSNSSTASSLSNLAAGTYGVTVTDSKGCTANASATVISPANFTISVSTTAVVCYGASTGSATVTVTNGTSPTYVWSNSSSSTTATISNLAAGSYTVTVTDAGCTKTASGTVTQPANALTVTASSTPSSCGNSTGSVTAVVTNNVGSPTYLWNNSGNSTTSTVSSLAAGVYSVTVTAGTCTATASAAVNNSNGPSLTVQQTNPTCFNLTNGSATVTVTGGSTPYTYTWSNNTHNSSITGVGAGTYTIVVSDANQCQGNSIVTLTQPDPITFNPTVSNVNCHGASTGSVTLAITGGTSPYQYLWSNNTSASSVTNVVAGSYTVTVTDSHSCTAVSTNPVTQPTALTGTVAVTPSSGSNGTAAVTAGGGTSPYSYSWSNSQTTASLTGLATGTYTVTVTDNKGCSVTAQGVILSVGINEVTEQIANVNLFPNPASDMINVVVELENTYTVQMSVTDMTGKVVYTTSQTANGKLSQIVDVANYAAGVYLVEVTTGQQSIRKRFVVSH